MAWLGRWLLLVWVIGLLTVQSAHAHGPGQTLELNASWCSETTGSVQMVSGVRVGENYPVCLKIQNTENFAISATFSLVPGTIDDQGRMFCLIPFKPGKSGAWLSEGDADGYVRSVIPANDTRQHTLSLHVASLSPYPKDNTGAPPFRGWFGCLLVDGLAVTEEKSSGHKNARKLLMIRVTE